MLTSPINYIILYTVKLYRSIFLDHQHYFRKIVILFQNKFVLLCRLFSPTFHNVVNFAFLIKIFSFFKKPETEIILVTTNELVINRLARHHLLAILMCQAINSNITGPVSNSITLDMNRKSLSF